MTIRVLGKKSDIARGRVQAVLILGAALTLLIGCAPTSRLPKTDSPEEVGTIDVHPTILKELKAGRKLIEFKDLLKAAAVFEAIRTGRQAFDARQSVLQVSLGATVGKKKGEEEEPEEPEEPEEGDEAAEATDGEEDAEGEDGKGDEGESSDDAAKSSALQSLLGESKPTPSYHELLYATADSILGGKALETIYNVEKLPEGYRLFSLPVIASVNPGWATRKNYTAEATLTLGEGECAEHLSILAVAPSGFTRVVESTVSDLRELSASIAVSAGEGLSGEAEALKQRLNEFKEVVSRPSLQVSIADRNQVQIRFLGRKTFTKRPGRYSAPVVLEPQTIATEVILMAKTDPCLCGEGGATTKCSAGPPASAIKKPSGGKTVEPAKGDGALGNISQSFAISVEGPASSRIGSKGANEVREQTLPTRVTTEWRPYFPLAPTPSEKDLERLQAEPRRPQVLAIVTPKSPSISRATWLGSYEGFSETPSAEQKMSGGTAQGGGGESQKATSFELVLTGENLEKLVEEKSPKVAQVRLIGECGEGSPWVNLHSATKKHGYHVFVRDEVPCDAKAPKYAVIQLVEIEGQVTKVLTQSVLKIENAAKAVESEDPVVQGLAITGDPTGSLHAAHVAFQLTVKVTPKDAKKPFKSAPKLNVLVDGEPAVVTFSKAVKQGEELKGFQYWVRVNEVVPLNTARLGYSLVVTTPDNKVTSDEVQVTATRSLVSQ